MGGFVTKFQELQWGDLLLSWLIHSRTILSMTIFFMKIIYFVAILIFLKNIDDIVTIWKGSEELLIQFGKYVNSAH